MTDPGTLPKLNSGEIALVHVADWGAAMIESHAGTPAGGEAQLGALRAATAAVRGGQARALITAPVSKHAIQSSGEEGFRGQTEWLAQFFQLADDDVTMMFLGPTLRVALVTTHLSIANVPQAITERRVLRAITHLDEALARLGNADATIIVAGLNPHAGEQGLFGHEEVRFVSPAIRQYNCPRVTGPVGAETAFRLAQASTVDGVVAMFHDQATIASKLLDWSAAVNVTWGLPIVRTSVDHGVAYDAAKAGRADPGSMIAAVQCAQRLAATVF